MADVQLLDTRYRGLMINPEVEASAAKQSVEDLMVGSKTTVVMDVGFKMFSDG